MWGIKTHIYANSFLFSTSLLKIVKSCALCSVCVKKIANQKLMRALEGKVAKNIFTLLVSNQNIFNIFQNAQRALILSQVGQQQCWGLGVQASSKPRIFFKPRKNVFNEKRQRQVFGLLLVVFEMLFGLFWSALKVSQWQNDFSSLNEALPGPVS